MLKIGSHVGMSGKDMMKGSVLEALSYGANTFMTYTGAPQNSKRKDISELNIDIAHEEMKKHGISDIIIHAPYIINLGNKQKMDKFEFAIEFLSEEINRAQAMGSNVMVLHPGAHVGEGVDIGIKNIVEGLNEIITKDCKVNIALETMAGKGTEVGRDFSELARIYDGVKYNDKLRVCFDTCHVNDAGYDIVNDFDGVIDEFDKIIGKDQIAVFHINDSKNPRGSHKDRHENIGLGTIGFDALNYIVHHKDFSEVVKILETPYVKIDEKKSKAPYKIELDMLKKGIFNDNLIEEIINA